MKITGKISKRAGDLQPVDTSKNTLVPPRFARGQFDQAVSFHFVHETAVSLPGTGMPEKILEPLPVTLT